MLKTGYRQIFSATSTVYTLHMIQNRVTGTSGDVSTLCHDNCSGVSIYIYHAIARFKQTWTQAGAIFFPQEQYKKKKERKNKKKESKSKIKPGGRQRPWP